MNKKMLFIGRRNIAKQVRLLCLAGLLLPMQTFGKNHLITVSGKNAPIITVMKQIEKQSGLTFFYDNSQVNTNRNVSISAKDQSLESVLATLFANTAVSYKVMNKNIVLTTKNESRTAGRQAQLNDQAKKRITGVVVDGTGTPIIGATVKSKDGKSAAVTDIDGNFVIETAPGSELEISYVGYQTTTIAAAANGKMNVTMREDQKLLDEVVVVGYGTVRKADLAGSVSVMNDKAFKDQPITDVSQAFQGRMAGVNVVQSGVPGGNVKIRVRGSGSISRSNDPLYVVDGIVRESGLEGINSEDIQSIQVLKDASSTAIYGSRGANGVVLIQTKSGKPGMQSVTFDASLGVSSATHMPKVMDARTYAQALLDGGKVANKAELQSYLDGSDKGIDWMDEILRTGITQNYKVVLTKGNADTQYYISGNYLNNKGVVNHTAYERYQAKMNIHSSIYKWLDVTADLQYAHSKGTGAGNFGMNESNNVLWIGYNYSPTMPMYDNMGNFHKDPYNSIQSNPYGLLAGNASQSRRDIINGRIDLKFNILPGLTFTTTNGFDYYDGKGYSFASTRVQPSNGMGNDDMQRMMLQTTNNLTYLGNWGKHSLTATGVFEASRSTTRLMGINGKNLQTESVGWWNVNNAVNRGASNGYSKWALLSGVGRLMYNYADRYMTTVTFRADGSSRFSDKKWGYFPSVAAAWTVTNEDFMKNVDWLSNLKLRASYGVIGNQSIDPYSTLGNMAATGYDFGTPNIYTGYWAAGIPTPELTWEKTKQFDFGVDMAFCNGRVELSIDYFSKKTTDALLRTQLTDYLGGTSYWINAGEVSNKGIDVSLTGRLIQTADLQWTSTINGTWLKNKVTKLTAENPIIYGSTPSQGTVDPATIVKEGEAIGTFYGYRWAGLKDGLDSYYDKDGNITAEPKGEDRTVLGCANPDVTIGWNNTITYKDWELNAFFNGAFGAQRLNLVRFAMNSMVGSSKFVTDADYISQIGKTMPALNAAGNKNYGNSSKWLENADYVRLENISIAYNLKKQLTRFADVRLAFSVQNLFTITGYKGIDPAGVSFSANSVDVDHGMDMGAYPCPRTFTFDVRFTF